MAHSLFIIAGEMSGDQLGSTLLKELYHLDPTINVMGIGGPKMREAGLKNLLFPTEALQTMGFIDVFFDLFRLLKLLRRTTKTILEKKPDMVVTIDYPGFNLRLIKTLRKKGFQGKLCHYVCPSVWIWGKNRVSLMAENLNLLLSILPFEKSFFSKTSLHVEYIGHPLAEKITVQKDRDPNLIAFFPGSRQKEIERNFPFFLRLIEALKKEFPFLKYAISVSQESYRPLLKQLSGGKLPLVNSKELQQLAPSLAVAKSGTIALELALQSIPSVIIYATSYLDRLLVKYLLKISLDFYTLPNLIAGRAIFRELIGDALTDKNLLYEVKKMIMNKEACRICQEECRALSLLLKKENVDLKAAQLLLHLCNQ